MKKFAVMLLSSVLLITSLTGCTAQPKPETTVTGFLDAFKTGQTMDYTLYFDSSTTAINDLALTSETTPSEVATAMKDLIFGFTYKILKSTVSKDKLSATVDLEITTFDGKQFLTSFMSQYIIKAMQYAFDMTLTTEQRTAKIESIAIELFTSVSSSMAKDKVYPATVNLVKVDKKWVMSGGETNFTLLDAMTGGMISASKEFAKESD